MATAYENIGKLRTYLELRLKNKGIKNYLVNDGLHSFNDDFIRFYIPGWRKLKLDETKNVSDEMIAKWISEFFSGIFEKFKGTGVRIKFTSHVSSVDDKYVFKIIKL